MSQSHRISFLRTSAGAEGYKELDEIKFWFRGGITDAEFFKRMADMSVEELRRGLKLAILEIGQNLDKDIDDELHAAQRKEYNMEVEERAFFAGRKPDIRLLVDDELDSGFIDDLDRDAVSRLLVEAKEEIEWERNEVFRFELHLKNAHMLISKEFRTSFQYRPMPRKYEEREKAQKEEEKAKQNEEKKAT